MPDTYLSLILKASKQGSGVTDATREMKDFEKSIESVRRTEAQAAAQHLKNAEALKSNSSLANVTKQSFAGLEKELQAGSLSAAGFEAATQKAGQSAGLISQASLKASSSITKLNSDYVTGKINADQYAAGLRSTQAELQASQGFMERYGAAVQTVAVVSLGALALGFANVSKSASDFEASMSVIVGLTNTTKEQIGGLTTEVLKMAPAVGKSPEELSKALYFISSSGYQGADALKILESSAKASAAGLGETKTIADSVTSALNAYGLGADQAGHFTDMFIQIVKEGKGEPQELANVLGRGLPIAKAAGISFEELGASIATMTLGGMDSAEAMTSFRGTVAALEAPGKMATGALKELGLSADDVRKSIRERGLLATLKDLMDRTGGNIETLDLIIPNIRALTGVLSAAGSQAGTYSEILGRMKTETGQTGDAFGVASETMAFKAAQASASFDSMKISLGNMLLPVLKDATTTIKGVADSFLALDPSTQKLVASMGLIALSAAPAMAGISKLGGMVKGLGDQFSTFNTMREAGDSLFKSLSALKTIEFGVLIAGLAVIVSYLTKVSETSQKSTEDLIKMAQSGDVLERAAAATNILTQGQDRLKTALDGTREKITQNADGYADYKSSLEATAVAAGYAIDAQGNLTQTTYGMGGAITKIVQANYEWSESTYNASKNTVLINDELTRFGGHVSSAVQATNSLAEANRQEVERLKGHVDAVKSLTDATKENTKATEEEKAAQTALGEFYGGLTNKAIDYTNSQEKMADLQAKLAKANADIAAAGPAQVATVQNKTMSEGQYAAALAKQAKLQEDLTQSTRKKNETDAEYASRMANVKVQLDNVTASLGTHTGVMGGATAEQLKNRDAIQEQIKAMVEQDATARAMEGMKALEEGLKTGRLTLDQYTSRVTAWNKETHLFTQEGMNASLAQTAFLQALSDPNMTMQQLTTKMEIYAETLKNGVVPAQQDAANGAAATAGAIAGVSPTIANAIPPVILDAYNASMTAAQSKAKETADAVSNAGKAIGDAYASQYDRSRPAATATPVSVSAPAIDMTAYHAAMQTAQSEAQTMSGSVTASMATVQTASATTATAITSTLLPATASLASDQNPAVFANMFGSNMGSVIESSGRAKGGLFDLKNAVDNLKSKEITITTHFVKIGNPTEETQAASGAASGGSNPAPSNRGYASGANFIVPAGYPNDSYPIMVQSGERVIVMTPEQMAKHSFANGTGISAAQMLSLSLISGIGAWQSGNWQTESIGAGYSGNVAKAMSDYIKKQTDMRKTAHDLESQLADLNKIQEANMKLLGMSAADTGEMSDEMKQLTEKYNEATQALKENADAHDEAMKKMILDIAQQQLSQGGWMQNEIDAFAAVAREMGLFDDASANLTKNVLNATAQLANDNNIAKFMQKLKAAVSSVSSTSLASQIGGAQFGGPISRPTLVGESGPELFFPAARGYVMDNADSARLIKALEMLAARSDTSATRAGNAFNLTVNTPSSANVLRDFAMLQALAGG